jgi:hypothetical protein
VRLPRDPGRRAGVRLVGTPAARAAAPRAAGFSFERARARAV